MTTPLLLAIPVQPLASELVEAIGFLLVFSNQQYAVTRTQSFLPHQAVFAASQP